MAEVFTLSHVSKTYKNDGKEFEALKDISLDIKEGEIFGVIGMSGAGKSTLVRTLNRLEEVSAGSVSFYGQDLAALKPAEIRKVEGPIHVSNVMYYDTKAKQPVRIGYKVENGLRKQRRL